jgi:hypothetical protein
MGARKNPKDERGPNPSKEMRHPHRMMISGVRQPMVRAGAEIRAMGNPSFKKVFR